MIGNGVQNLAHLEGLVFNCFAAIRNLRRKLADMRGCALGTCQQLEE